MSQGFVSVLPKMFSGYPNFEVVVWTVENSITFYPIILGMDPQQQHIMYKLYRDATHYNNGVHVKQLSNLNRDLRKVIVIDWNKDHVEVSLVGLYFTCRVSTN